MQNLKLQVLWLNDSLGICGNYHNARGFIQLTSYDFWPVSDAWEQLKAELDSKVWIDSEERVKILNLVVETITKWQKNRTPNDLKLISRKTNLVPEKFSLVGLS